MLVCKAVEYWNIIRQEKEYLPFRMTFLPVVTALEGKYIYFSIITTERT